MPFDVPFKLGPFMVDPLGRLTPNAPEASPVVHVRWRGLWVTVRLSARQTGAGHDGALDVATVIGRVRSTAAGQPHLRPQALETLCTLPREMLPGWQMRVQPDHSARIDAVYAIALPATATALVTVLTGFLLDLAPYLDLLAEPDAGFEAPAGVSPGIVPPAIAGTLNT